jgi:hypothetical protein
MYDQSNAYRRGVILGLTLAEIMLLILFLLLLTFASVLNREKIRYEQKIQLLSKKNKNVEKVISVLEKSDPSITDEMVEAFEYFPIFTNLIKKENLKKNEYESTKQVITRAINKLIAEKSMEKGGGDLSVEERLQASISENKELMSKVENLQGQNKNILNQLSSQGKGYDLPPCWAYENGKAEFTYNVFLSNDGIRVEETKLPKWKNEKAKLPTSDIQLSEPISKSQFIAQTRDIRKWAIDHQCHFYARIYNENVDSVPRYKALLLTVEGVFYKKLM